MRRRRVICMLGIAAVSLLHGCADSSAPSKATRPRDRRNSAEAPVVVATHYDSVQTLDVLLDEAVFAPLPPAQQRSTDIRRLPPVHPVVRTRTSTRVAPASERRFERLPNLNRVAAAQPRPYAIDLTKRHEPTLTPPANSLVPSIIKIVTEKSETPEPVVPKKRFVAAKAPKPPLPPLTNQSAAAPSGSKGWLMTGTSLFAVSQRADGMIDHGFQLAEKGAFYSAQTEFKQALRTVAQALDAHYGGSQHSEALAAGWLALDEAGDFSAQSQRGPVVDVGVIVASHRTTLLKDYALDEVSPVLAMQHYFAFAQEQLLEACGQAPVASRALHGLGKIHMVLGEKSGSAERLHGPKAIAFQQAALTTDPANFLAANELGVLLARFGKLQEARTVLQYAVSYYPLPETWENLSVVHTRLGESELAAQAFANWQVVSQQTSGPATTPEAANGSMVQWVSPQAFMGQQPGPPNAPSMPQPATPPTGQTQAKRKSGFLWW